MDNTQIIASEAFRALNLMLDRAAIEAVGYAEMAIDAAKLETQYTDYMSVRTYEEGGKQVDLPIARERLKRVRDLADDALAAIARVGEIQGFKMRLLNDWDFTKGDSTDQQAVFADAIAPEQPS